MSSFGTFRTLKFSNGLLPPTKLPVALLLRSSYTKEFLRVAFSCDGGVSLYVAYRKGTQGGTKWLIRTVFLACAHPALRSDYVTLITSLGIRVREVSADGKIKIETEQDIRLFAKHIGFVPGVRATGDSKFWKGEEKNAILNLLISSYGNPAMIYKLPKFNEVMI